MQKSTLWSRQAMKKWKGNHRRTNLKALGDRETMENIHSIPTIRRGAWLIVNENL